MATVLDASYSTKKWLKYLMDDRLAILKKAELPVDSVHYSRDRLDDGLSVSRWTFVLDNYDYIDYIVYID